MLQAPFCHSMREGETEREREMRGGSRCRRRWRDLKGQERTSEREAKRLSDVDGSLNQYQQQEPSIIGSRPVQMGEICFRPHRLCCAKGRLCDKTFVSLQEHNNGSIGKRFQMHFVFQNLVQIIVECFWLPFRKELRLHYGYVHFNELLSTAKKQDLEGLKCPFENGRLWVGENSQLLLKAQCAIMMKRLLICEVTSQSSYTSFFHATEARGWLAGVAHDSVRASLAGLYKHHSAFEPTHQTGI